MKSLSVSLNRLLLLTSMLIAPSIAHAQESPPAPDAPIETVQDAAATGEENEIVVRGRFIPEPMRQTSEVSSFLSSEDLARQGDDTAASALTRLTGLSVVSGRFVFVRGLGDRYSSALLNGSPLPSPEPLRRTVPLDIFPSNILDGATVQKTFSPNYPGEFGGGIIDLQTLRQPSAPFFSAKVGTGGNTETVGERGYLYRGNDIDWMGFDNGLRDLPDPVRAAIDSGVRFSELSDATLERLGESFINSPFTVLQSENIVPDFELEASGGTSIDLGRFNLGLVGVVGYDSAWRTQQAQREFGIGSRLRDLDQVTTTWDITANALGTVSLGWEDHELSVTTLLVRSTTKEAQFNEGCDVNIGSCEFDPDPSTPNLRVRNEGTGWYERSLSSLQLAGEHTFGPLEIDWRAAGARSTRDAPYERSIRYLYNSEGVPFYTQSSPPLWRFSELTDDVMSGGVDVAYTLPLSEQRDAVFSAGYAYSNTVREYELFSFSYQLNGTLPADVITARPDFLFSPDNIDPLRFRLIELTGPDDAYKGGLLVNAAYVSADVELAPLLRAAIGVRYEEGDQTVRTLNRFGDPTVSPTRIQNNYWLPAATMTWNFAEDLQLRLGYSETIARPQFRELAVSPYSDPETDRDYRGNPFLTDTRLTNYDARLEYYFGRGQFVTLGGFYKDIEAPIEEVISQSSDLGVASTFINAPHAVVYGGEFEFRTNFSMPFDIPFLSDETWFFSANYTYTKSEIQAEDGDTVLDPLTPAPSPRPASDFALDGQPLQGLAEHIANVQFGFDTGISQLTLLVGWVDERILQRGLGTDLGDIIEDPGVNVDLVYRRGFDVGGNVVTLGLSARNLLNEAHSEFLSTDQLGRLEANTYDRGMSFSASLTAKF